MQTNRLRIFLLLISAMLIFTGTNTAQIKHSVPTAKIGDFELTTQAFGFFGTVPHKSIKKGALNYYAEFSFWAGGITKDGETRVSSGDQTEKDSQPEWTPVPKSWKENVKSTVPSVKMVNSGEFTDTRSFKGHTPLGLLIKVTSYSFSNKGFALYDYKVTLEKGYPSLKDFYIGFQADVDVPNREGKLTSDDDKLGLLPDGRGIYIYDGEEEKKTTSLLGIVLLSSEKPILSWWTRKTDPKTDKERYELLRGNNNYPESPEEKCDYRFMVSDGPYTLNPGEVIHLTVGIIQAEGENLFETQSKAADLLFAKSLKATVLTKSKTPQTEKQLVESPLPGSFKLYHSFPNPFNSQTEIIFDLPESQQVDVTIYNLLGQPVRALFRGNKQAGTHTFRWDGRDDTGNSVVSGVYLLIVKAGERRFQEKLILMK